MHKFLIVLMLVCSSAHAEKWLETKNESGGRIVLMQADCDNSGKGKMILATHANGQTIKGCWWFFAGAVQVVYDDGAKYSYSPEIFIVKEDK